MKLVLFCLLGLLPISACAGTRAVPVPLSGLEAFQQPCSDLPPTLSIEDAASIAFQIQAALALEAPVERDAALARALRPMTQRDQDNRTCALYERRRADGLLALAGRFNQTIAEAERE